MEENFTTSNGFTIDTNDEFLTEEQRKQDIIDIEAIVEGVNQVEQQQAEYDPDSTAYDQHRTSWILTTILIVAETASSGPLSNASAVAVVGFVPGTILFVGLGIIATYTAILLHEFWKEHKHIRNYDEAGEIVLGRPGKEVILWCQIALLIFFNASVIQPAADALYVLANENTCYVIFSVIITVFGIILSIPRTLRGVSYLSIVCIVSWIAALVPTLVGVATQDAPMPGVKPGTDIHLAAASSASFYDIVSAVNDIVYAYSGHMVFFNLILEMRHPMEFRKAVITAFAITTVSYTFYGVFIYGYTGIYAQSPYFFNLVNPKLEKAAFFLQIPNLIIAGVNYAYLATKNVLRRFPSKRTAAYKHDIKSWSLWLFLVATFWWVPWLLEELIPVFDNLIGIGGALFASQFTYGLPCLFWIYQHRSNALKWPYICLTTLNTIIFLLAWLSLGVGVYSNIENIKLLSQAGQIPKPFSCSE
eukprot:jgi/Galph1/4479/GphlegSOOS_G3134.1